MCGIAGAFAQAHGAPAPGRDLLEAMAAAMVHRGPDDDGFLTAPGIGLAMRRLSIIDLETGKQPATNESGHIHAILNGEIYNYRELRDELIGKGHEFRTQSDTEVLVHGYEEEGVDFLQRLNGMFGLAIWDANAERLVIARDRMGIKPLYYARRGDWLLFASEMKVLLAHPALGCEIDPTALDLYLALGYVPAPYSILKGVRKLEPGHRIVATRDRVTVERWWALPNERLDKAPPDAAERVRALLASAVRRRCIADVPLGAFLSGGIDSSAIVGLMRETGQDPVRTFSIGFEDKSYDETEYAREIARRFQTDHVEKQIGPDSWKLTGRLARQLDEPFADTSLYPTFLVSELAREHVTVVLSGDGGDELFGGYHAYRAQEIDRVYHRVPRILRRMVARGLLALRPTRKKRGFINSAQRFVHGSSLPEALGHMRWMLHADEEKLALLRGPNLSGAATGALERMVAEIHARASALSPMERAMYVDMHLWLPDDILTKVDRMSMAVSLEARTPFLDHELVEYVARLPEAVRVHGGRTKIILRKCLEDLLPEHIIQKPKEGFSIPMKNWLRNELREEAEAKFDPRRLARHDFFDAEGVRGLWDEHQAGQANHAHVLFALLMFESWYEEVVGAPAGGSV